MAKLIVLFGILFSFQSQAVFCYQSFNAYGPAYSFDLKKRTKNLIQLLSKESPCEIMSFQEVWNKSHIKRLKRGLLTNQLATKFNHADENLEGSKTGLLIASQFTLVNVDSYLYGDYVSGASDWLRDKLGVHKAFSFSIVNVVADSDVADVGVINTHLHHASQAIRLAQIIELGDYLRKPKIQELPLIVSGDFNATPYSLEWWLIQADLMVRDSHITVHPDYEVDDFTYDSENPYSWGGKSRALDYVFYRPSNLYEISVEDSIVFPRTYEGEYLSDHYGKKNNFKLDKSSIGLSDFGMPVADRINIYKKAYRVFKKQKSNKFERVIVILQEQLVSLENEAVGSGFVCDPLLTAEH